MTAKTQNTTNVAFAQPEMDHPRTAIITQCPRCHKEGEVRGLDMPDLTALSPDVASSLKAVNGGQQFAIVRMCANCKYRTGQNGKPLSEAQKEARRRYNKGRQEKSKEALQFVASLTDEQREAFRRQYLEEQEGLLELTHQGNGQ